MRQYLEWYNVFNQELVIPQDESQYDHGWTKDRQAQQAVLEFYKANKHRDSFLWITSIWSPDVPWATPISSPSDFKTRANDYYNNNRMYRDGKKISDSEFRDVRDDYSTVTQILRDDKSLNSSNGLLILVVLSAGAMAASQLAMQKMQRANSMGMVNPNSQLMTSMQSQMKIMMWIMPAVMFALYLSQPAAFTLYMGVSSTTTLIINITSTFVLKTLEKANEKSKTKKVQKYGRPDPNDLIDDKQIQDIKFDDNQDD
jgi:pimeloyl-ACP methyl ester carboxylesterase